jgi:hypothetical protein
MKRVLYVALILSVFVILGNVSTAWSTSVNREPTKWPGLRQAQITNASNNLASSIGSQARITAIRGNQITMQHLTDASKTVTVTVNNTALFKVGQHVDVTEHLLTPR